jgi:hypothetical protein
VNIVFEIAACKKREAIKYRRGRCNRWMRVLHLKEQSLLSVRHFMTSLFFHVAISDAILTHFIKDDIYYHSLAWLLILVIFKNLFLLLFFLLPFKLSSGFK